MSRPHGIALCVLLWTLSSGSAAAQSNSIFDSADHLWVVGDVRVVPVADTFALMRVSRFPDLRLGVALTYSSPIARNLDMSIYVYPTRDGDQDPAQDEFERALQDIHDYAERREWEVEVRRVGPYSLDSPSGPALEGNFAEAEYSMGDRKRRSVLHLFVRDGLVLKYRVTHETSDEETLRPHLDEWMRVTAAQTGRFPG